MDLYYKTYQKIRIYLDKIKRALPNLDILNEHCLSIECIVLVMARHEELRLIQAKLVDFFLSLKNTEPYVPSSRCKAITSWYGLNELRNPMTLANFQEDLIESDNVVIEEAGYVISDGQMPSLIKNMFKEHVQRYTKIKKSIIKEK